MNYYVITISMPGYLPEADPYVVEDEHPPTRVLECIRDEVDHAAQGIEQTSEEPDGWDLLLKEIEDDRDRAGDFDTSLGSGFGYTMPDGYVIEATSYSREQLLELGYTSGEDFD